MRLLDAIGSWAMRDPDRPAIQCGLGEVFTYADLQARIAKLAAGLAKIGVKRGDTVLLMIPNGIDIVEAWLAVNYLGAVEVPVNIHERGRFLSHIVNDSRAEVMVIDAGLTDRVAAIASDLRYLRRVVVTADDHEAIGRIEATPLEELRCASTAGAAEETGDRDLMAILYTSGTTGPAKGIMMTYGQAALCARNYLTITGLCDEDSFFLCMPLFHSNAQVIQLMPSLIMGARVSIWPRFEAKTWLTTVREVQATISNTLGVMCDAIYREPELADDSSNPLRVLQTIPLPKAIAVSFERRFNVKCIDGYGLTDVGMISYRRPGDALAPGSSGRPVDDYEVIIADPDTDEPLPRNRIGEILVRPRAAWSFTAGYWNNPEATVRAWRGLWFHTGDAGYLDDQGLLYFHDRLKDTIRVRGENVSSAQVEAEFNAHPAVLECSAVAVQSDRGDDEIKLCVVFVPGCRVAPEELLDFCSPNMPYFAVPRYIEVLDDLPKTSTGKVRKTELRHLPASENLWDRKEAGYVVR